MTDQWEKITCRLYENDIYSRIDEVHKVMMASIPTDRPQKILDMGCGDGSFLAKVTDGKHELYGFDVSEKQLERAREKKIKAQYVNIDNTSLPYEDNFFDVIICSEVIEHVLVPDNILKEAHRTLKGDGVFIVTTPNLGSLGRRLLLLVNRNPFIELSPMEKNAVGHLRYFLHSTLKEIAERYGFRIEKFTSDVVNFGSFGFMQSRWLAKYFPSLGRTLIFILAKNNE